MLATVIGATAVEPSFKNVRRGYHSDTLLKLTLELNGDVRAGVVHVVALDALVHHAEAAADNGLAAAGKVIGKADARTKRCPLIIHQTLGNSGRLTRDADTVQIELSASRLEIGLFPTGLPCNQTRTSVARR